MTDKKYPFPLPESSDKHLTAGEERSRLRKKTGFVPVLSVLVGCFCEESADVRDVSTDGKTFLIYM